SRRRSSVRQGQRAGAARGSGDRGGPDPAAGDTCRVEEAVPRRAGEEGVMAEQVTLRVWRGDADAGDFQDYRVEAEEGEVVLDVLHRLQATQAGDLAVRWNCKAGRCGS